MQDMRDETARRLGGKRGRPVSAEPADAPASVVWESIPVQVSNPSSGYAAQDYFFKAWKAGHPLLVAYGDTPRDAITALLNKHGE